MEKNDINSFKGWDNLDTVNFFEGDSEIVEESSDKKEEENLENKAKEKKEEKEKKKEEIDKEKENEIFKSFNEGSDEEVGEVGEVGENNFKEDNKVYSGAINTLKNKGLLSYELKEGEELTEERAEEILEEGYSESVEDRVKELVEGFPEVLKEMISYHKNGGDVENLISNISPSVNIDKNLDLSKEENQETIVKEHLREEGYDNEYIENNIEFLKDSDKLESISKKLFNKIIEKQEETIKNEYKKQENLEKEARQKQREFKSEISGYLKEVDDIKTVKFSLKEKRELPSYISDATIKLENGQRISSLQRDLYKTLQDKDKTLILAKILKSDFDFSDIVKDVTTKVTKNIKKDLEHSQKIKPSRSTNNKGLSRRGNILDYF